MALIETARLYEVLIRFDAHGAPSALQRWIEEVHRDGEVIHARERQAQPLEPAEVSGLIQAAHALLLAENARMRAILTPEQRVRLGLEA
jgi:hypothetical protein